MKITNFLFFYLIGFSLSFAAELTEDIQFKEVLSHIINNSQNTLDAIKELQKLSLTSKSLLTQASLFTQNHADIVAKLLETKTKNIYRSLDVLKRYRIIGPQAYEQAKIKINRPEEEAEYHKQQQNFATFIRDYRPSSWFHEEADQRFKNYLDEGGDVNAIFTKEVPLLGNWQGTLLMFSIEYRLYSRISQILDDPLYDIYRPDCYINNMAYNSLKFAVSLPAHDVKSVQLLLDKAPKTKIARVSIDKFGIDHYINNYINWGAAWCAETALDLAYNFKMSMKPKKPKFQNLIQIIHELESAGAKKLIEINPSCR